MERARCRSCDAVIVWCVTERGRRIPLDPDPHPAGNVVRVGREAVRVIAVGEDPGCTRYRSHWASCPDAAAWRRGEATAATGRAEERA